MPDALRLSAAFSASPARVQAAWLDGEQHAAMTGAVATGNAEPGSPFTAWDGYIEGENLEIAPGRIVQSWRAADFPEGAGPSRLEVHFDTEGAGTRVTVVHTDLPDGTGPAFTQGWEEYYFTPMRGYFTAP